MEGLNQRLKIILDIKKIKENIPAFFFNINNITNNKFAKTFKEIQNVEYTSYNDDLKFKIKNKEINVEKKKLDSLSIQEYFGDGIRHNAYLLTANRKIEKNIK